MFKISRLRPLALRFHTSAYLRAKKDFLTPAVGEGIVELEIVEWYVKEGDALNEFDQVCSVQTDKATTDITSRFAGTVTKLHFSPGEIAKVGLPLLTLETDEEGDVQVQEVKQKAPERFEETVVSPLATPAVRRLAKEHDVDLSKVKATGPGGRILKYDVMVYMKELGTSDVEDTSPDDILSSKVEISSKGQDKVIKTSGLARIMVQSMTKAAMVPAMGLCDELDISELVHLKTLLKLEAVDKGIKLTMFPFILKAASIALLDFPILNGLVNEDASEVLAKGDHNIGLAMDTPRGLLVPNIKNIESRSILDIAIELNRLQKLGKENKLGKTDLTGGTFTLSNIGAIGGTVASPILFVPQVAIGALGRSMSLPRFDEDGNVVKRDILTVSWSADHRVIDGATLARFSNRFKQLLERPGLMLLHLK